MSCSTYKYNDTLIRVVLISEKRFNGEPFDTITRYRITIADKTYNTYSTILMRRMFDDSEKPDFVYSRGVYANRWIIKVPSSVSLHTRRLLSAATRERAYGDFGMAQELSDYFVDPDQEELKLEYISNNDNVCSS